MKTFVYTVIIIVIVAVVAGFFVVGSPFRERQRRFDERRVQDLSQIQSEVITYWTNKGKLHEKLADLNDSIRGVVVPKDPETGAGYGYKMTGAVEFSLCADFSLPSPEKESGAIRLPAAPYDYSQTWEHGAGEVCFDRKIDKDLYPPRKDVPIPPLSVPVPHTN